MKKFIVFILVLLVCFSLSANNSLSLSLTTDFAYYLEKNPIATNEDYQFIPPSGPYSGLEARSVFLADYKIPIPGNNMLTSGNNVVLSSAFEVSPVSVKPAFSLAYTPIAFLNFKVGANILAGWFLPGLNVDGLAIWNETKQKYEGKNFTVGLYESWISGTFMFDLAAVFPGDWNHVVTLNTFKVSHTALTNGGSDGTPWLAQGSGEKVNGFKYNANFTFGYQMPMTLQMIGLQVILDGYFGSPYKEIHSGMNGFMTVQVSPFMILEFNKNHALTFQFQFSSRPSYSTVTEGSDRLSQVKPVGREMFFDRIALSYCWKF